MSGHPNFYTPVEIIKENKGRMDENEKLNNIESEMRDLFGITDDSSTDETTSQTNTNETQSQQDSETTSQNSANETSSQNDTESRATDDTESQSQQENTSSVSAEKDEPAKSSTETTNNKSTAKDTLLNPEDKFTKQNSAFAQMRIQNKELSDLLMNLAQATGQNPKNINEAQEILKGGLNKVISKNRNIPEDVLREMEEDKKALAEFKQSQARQKAIAGFQQVKDMHELSREEVNNFADKLIENKLNPFEQDLDLVKEYRHLYFDELIAKAKEQGVQEERARSLKAQQNSTTPSTQKGLPDNAGNQGTPIKSIADLDKLLDSLK